MTNKLKIFTALCCAYCVVVVTGNLIFAKIVNFNILGLVSFEVSVGVLMYPVTFLLIDLIVECFGKQWAKTTVLVGVFVSFLVMILLWLSDHLGAVTWSPVSNEVFHKVFHVYGIAAVASLVANYVAQSCGIMIFVWLKNKTKGRHLWLRNNANTIVAQFIDTACVISLLCFFNILPWDKWMIITLDSFFLKFIMAICDTPFCYLGHFWINKKLRSSTLVEEIA